MVEKTLFSDTDLKIEILKKGEDLTGFTCGNKTLDDFFHQEVVLCCKYKYLSAYTVKHIKTNEIVCLFTLANDVITLDKEDVEDIKEEDIEMLAEKAMEDPCKPGNPREVTKEDIKGKVIVFPTDTVYGIASNITNENAIKKAFDARIEKANNYIDKIKNSNVVINRNLVIRFVKDSLISTDFRSITGILTKNSNVKNAMAKLIKSKISTSCKPPNVSKTLPNAGAKILTTEPEKDCRPLTLVYCSFGTSKLIAT